MRSAGVFMLLLVLAAARPLTTIAPVTDGDAPVSAFPGWPAAFAGKPLIAVPLDSTAQRFAAAFPGRIARFTDGRRELIVRWVVQPTRKLHPAADCYRALGYDVMPAPITLGRDRTAWSGFLAQRDGVRMRVSEQIADGDGDTWPDASAWYWTATLGASTGPWWAVTVVEAADGAPGALDGLRHSP